MKWDFFTYFSQPTFFINELKDFFKKKLEAEQKAADRGRRST
jgi:hypothetical protein